MVISSRVSLTIEKNSFKVWQYITKPFLVNSSVDYAELYEFNFAELICYKVW